MKGISLIRPPQSFLKFLFSLVLLLSAVLTAAGQLPTSVDPENVQRRISRARALAAAGNLPAARSELESLRAVATDESIKEIALVLLMGIYFQQSDFTYAENLLNEAFHARAPGNEVAARRYYLLAGQAINGVRAQIDRYREFGLDVSDTALPPEAVAHLERLRKLLEQVVTQGRQLREENVRSIDAAALLENAAGARVLLARNGAERAQWQREVADVRQRLAGATPRASGIAKPPPPQPAATPAAPEPSPTPAHPDSTAVAPEHPSDAGRTLASQSAAAPAQGGSPPAGRPDTSTQPANGADATKSAATAATEPVEVGSLISRAAQTVAPGYPPAARNARIMGRVTVFLLVDEKGVVSAIKRTDGPELLRRAAEDAARRWKFRPTIINGQPIRVTGFISFNFEL